MIRRLVARANRADVLDLVRDESEVAPGVRLVPAPGHTVGHCAVLLESGADRAVCLADALLDEFQLVRPDWVSAVGMLPDETVRARTWLLDEAPETVVSWWPTTSQMSGLSSGARGVAASAERRPESGSALVSAVAVNSSCLREFHRASSALGNRVSKSRSPTQVGRTRILAI